MSDWTLPPLLARAPVFMFSGQGAQKPGMGADLLDIPEVKGTFSCASDVLGYDVADLVLNADPDELNDTRNAQPALCVLSVGIARALAANPRYLVADEVSTMLDAVTQAQIWRFLVEETQARGIGLVFVSHSHALTERIATRVVDLAMR